MELAVDRAVQHQRQAAQIINESRGDVVDRRFLEVDPRRKDNFKHELDDDALGGCAERHRIVDSAAQKDYGRLKEVVDVVIGGASELAELHARLALDEHVA